MSITTLTVRNHFSEVREMLGMGFREHSHEIVVGAIMVGISIALALAVSGNLNDALAMSRRR
ncbi:MAG: hypothetical protein ABJB85_09920 [Nitrososphaerota archaeon]